MNSKVKEFSGDVMYRFAVKFVYEVSRVHSVSHAYLVKINAWVCEVCKEGLKFCLLPCVLEHYRAHK